MLPRTLIDRLVRLKSRTRRMVAPRPLVVRLAEQRRRLEPGPGPAGTPGRTRRSWQPAVVWEGAETRADAGEEGLEPARSEVDQTLLPEVPLEPYGDPPVAGRDMAPERLERLSREGSRIPLPPDGRAPVRQEIDADPARIERGSTSRAAQSPALPLPGGDLITSRSGDSPAAPIVAQSSVPGISPHPAQDLEPRRLEPPSDGASHPYAPMSGASGHAPEPGVTAAAPGPVAVEPGAGARTNEVPEGAPSAAPTVNAPAPGPYPEADITTDPVLTRQEVAASPAPGPVRPIETRTGRRRELAPAPTRSPETTPAPHLAPPPVATDRSQRRASEAAPRPDLTDATPPRSAADLFQPAGHDRSPQAWASKLAAMQHPGPAATSPAPGIPTPLREATRRFLAPLIGIDPASVPVFRDAAADAVAAGHHAEAVTLGEQVLVSSATTEQTPRGLAVLAHELTHVARQRDPRFIPPVLLRDDGRSAPARAADAASQIRPPGTADAEEALALAVERRVRQAASGVESARTGQAEAVAPRPRPLLAPDRFRATTALPGTSGSARSAEDASEATGTAGTARDPGSASETPGPSGTAGIPGTTPEAAARPGLFDAGPPPIEGPDPSGIQRSTPAHPAPAFPGTPAGPGPGARSLEPAGASWGGLPAPWEPLPTWPARSGDSDAATTHLLEAPPTASMTAVALPLPDTAAASTTAAPTLHRAGLERPIGEDASTTRQAPAPATPPAPEPDLDLLARQVHAVLKRRLGAERRRQLNLD